MYAAAEDQGDRQPAVGVDSEPAKAMLVVAGAVQLVLQALRPACAHRVTCDRVLQGDAPADQLRGQLTGAGGDDELVASR